MPPKVSLIFTFYSAHFALKLEAACRKENILAKLIPVPRSISSSCGIAFQGEVVDKEVIERIAREHEIEIEQVVEYQSEERKSILGRLFKK